MLDFIRIGLRIQKESEVFISAQRRFEDVKITYQIHSEKIDSPIMTTFVTSDSVVIEKITYLINSLYKFYSEEHKLKGNYHYDFTYKNLCVAIDRIIEQLPFLKSSELALLEFGFDFENPIYANNIEKKTASIFKGRYSMLTTSYQPLGINDEASKEKKCSNMSLKINLKPVIV
ncbi:hypothetical protein [Flavobacterium acetivorans]|uniref:hypothetical protein n=1 Tax=Flavobacterium acetivorans TaxID=2893883 RepID=UPI001E2B458C|nr:hypothetical protein [Flavobacterium sp. F-29]UFH36072.1 hypothetical protein LNP19_03285 [Flavobacterium sp. F-29]